MSRSLITASICGEHTWDQFSAVFSKLGYVNKGLRFPFNLIVPNLKMTLKQSMYYSNMHA